MMIRYDTIEYNTVEYNRIEYASLIGKEQKLAFVRVPTN